MSDGSLQSLVNGQQAEHISIRDRGFQYGDGCFETIRVLHNKPILWSAHLARLQRACNVLQLSVDFELLQEELSQLLSSSAATDALVKITVTRGEGGRGYTPTKLATCTRVLQLIDYAAPNKVKGASAIVCRQRLSSSKNLAGIKHLNRLEQVLASAEIPDGCDEGICMDEAGHVIEGCRSNLLLNIENELLTPELSRCGVAGVMLNYLLEKFAQQGVQIKTRSLDLAQLKNAKEIILCNSVFGVWPLAEISGVQWQASEHERSFTIQALEIHNKLFEMSLNE